MPVEHRPPRARAEHVCEVIKETILAGQFVSAHVAAISEGNVEDLLEIRTALDEM